MLTSWAGTGSILPCYLTDLHLLFIVEQCLRSYCMHRLEETAALLDAFFRMNGVAAIIDRSGQSRYRDQMRRLI
jgi:hypothetical protein